MSDACRTPDCTVGDTGVCLLGNDPTTCEFRIRAENGEVEAPPRPVDLSSPILETPEERPTLWGSLPLEIGDVRNLMASRQCVLIGVVGTPAAGKTAALVSMYLLIAHGALAGYQFADSKSLTAFEEISQGARLWGETPPDEMTARTKTSGSRVAGFLHLRVKELATGRLVDFLVPDLPGEWSDTLIDNNRTDRLDFIKAAHVIWLFVSGSELRKNASRMYTLNRTKLLIGRVAAMLGDRRPPVRIVVSHADEGDLPEATIDKLNQMLADNEMDGEIIDIASFSKSEVAAGTGIPDLITLSLPQARSSGIEWPIEESDGTGRFMLRYGGALRQ